MSGEGGLNSGEAPVEYHALVLVLRDVELELAATLGATMGALGSGLVGDTVLTIGLAVVAAAAALVMLLRTSSKGESTPQDRTVGEWPGQIAGVAPTARMAAGGGVVYEARRIPTGLGLMWVSGVVAGVAGASGGFIKTPVTTEVMGIPLKIAASTTTFTIGVTAAAGLVVFALQGRIDPFAAAAVIAGSLIGGQVGAALQARAPTSIIRRGLGGLLLLIAVLLVASA